MELLTVTEVCEPLRISRATLYNLIEKEKLPLLKIGGKSLIRKQVINHLIPHACQTAPKGAASTKKEASATYWDELIPQGLVDPASRRAFFDPEVSDFKRVKAKGKPGSEIIIEGRERRYLPASCSTPAHLSRRTSRSLASGGFDKS